MHNVVVLLYFKINMHFFSYHDALKNLFSNPNSKVILSDFVALGVQIFWPIL